MNEALEVVDPIKGKFKLTCEFTFLILMILAKILKLNKILTNIFSLDTLTNGVHLIGQGWIIVWKKFLLKNTINFG